MQTRDAYGAGTRNYSSLTGVAPQTEPARPLRDAYTDKMLALAAYLQSNPLVTTKKETGFYKTSDVPITAEMTDGGAYLPVKINPLTEQARQLVADNTKANAFQGLLDTLFNRRYESFGLGLNSPVRLDNRDEMTRSRDRAKRFMNADVDNLSTDFERQNYRTALQKMLMAKESWNRQMLQDVLDRIPRTPYSDAFDARRP